MSPGDVRGPAAMPAAFGRTGDGGWTAARAAPNVPLLPIAS